MERVRKSIDVDVPLHAAYEQWNRFEEFPDFMEDVQEVRQLDDGRFHWRATLAGQETEWDSEIVEQVPDRVIAWRSLTGPPNSGRVTFEPLGEDRTRVQVQMEYEPENALQKVGGVLGLVSRKLGQTVEDFKQHVERRRA